jgi:hypothetical protein
MVHPGSSKLGLTMESLEELLCKVMSYLLSVGDVLRFFFCRIHPVVVHHIRNI